MSDVSEELRAVLHAKEKCCEELLKLPESGNGEDYAGMIAKICADYANCGQVPPEYSEVLDKKFSEALEVAKKGAEKFEARKEAEVQLVKDVESIVAAGELATLSEVNALEKRIAELSSDAALIEKLAPLKAALQAEADAEKPPPMPPSNLLMNLPSSPHRKISPRSTIAKLRSKKSSPPSAKCPAVPIPAIRKLTAKPSSVWRSITKRSTLRAGKVIRANLIFVPNWKNFAMCLPQSWAMPPKNSTRSGKNGNSSAVCRKKKVKRSTPVISI